MGLFILLLGKLVQLGLDLQNNAGLSVVQLRLAAGPQLGANATRFSDVFRQCTILADAMFKNKGKVNVYVCVCGRHVHQVAHTFHGFVTTFVLGIVHSSEVLDKD